METNRKKAVVTTSTWNKKEIETQFDGCQTLKEVISRIETDFSLRGEVICEIRVNGMLLDEEDEVKFAASSVGEIDALAVRSNRPADLINDAIVSASEFVPELDANCLMVAEAFRGNDIALAQKNFSECLEGCQWLVETLMHVRGAASGVGQPIGKPERWFEAEKVINKAIRELSQAYGANDFVLVADLLEYEVTAAVQIWNEALSEERAARKI
jgi:hypothetical protein